MTFFVQADASMLRTKVKRKSCTPMKKRRE
jgi:hypothetical protein